MRSLAWRLLGAHLAAIAFACNLLTGSGSQPAVPPPTEPPAAAAGTPAIVNPTPALPPAPELPGALTWLRVANLLAVDRIGEPVTSGIPLPSDLAISDPRKLTGWRADRGQAR